MRTIPTTSLLVLGAAFAACSGSGSKPRSGTLMLSATAGPIAEPLVVPLATGELQVASALFHVGSLEIEMHRTMDTANHGGMTEASEEEGGQGENENEQGENENEHEGDVVDDIKLPGPYTFELIAPSTVLEQVPVVPGTFDRVQMRFVLTPDDPFLGGSIFLRGVFVDGTTSTPFTLRSDFDGHTVVPIANGGITVTANAIVQVALVFDLTSLLTHLDFASATVDGGEITIDATHNIALLLMFEAGLGGCVHAHEDD
jgi:hypothetical protein